MTERLEQRRCIKFYQELGDTQVETIKKIKQTFGDDAMSITQIKEWYNRFKDGCTSVESGPRLGRPSKRRNKEIIDQVRTLVTQNRRVTIRELTDEVGISIGSVHSILMEDLAIKRLRRESAKFMHKMMPKKRKAAVAVTAATDESFESTNTEEVTSPKECRHSSKKTKNSK